MKSDHYIRDYNFLHRHATGDNREWRKRSPSSYPKRFVSIEDNRKKYCRRAIWGIVAMVVLLLFSVSLILLLLNGESESVRICVPGFSGTHCERSNFIGTYSWSTNDFYTLDDGLQHRNGIAFRVFAPNAAYVVLNIKPVGATESHYNMTQQVNGFWFVNVGSVGAYSVFDYDICNHSGHCSRRLIQGGKELIFSNGVWRNRDPFDYNFGIGDEQSPTSPQRPEGEFRKVNENVMYILHVPSFTGGMNDIGTYTSTIQYLDYLKYLGVTVIRLMNLSPMICSGDSEVDPRCWFHASVLTPEAPHPDLGSLQDLKRLVSMIHDRGMKVLFEMDWTGFSNQSSYYNYDESGIPTAYGPLFMDAQEYSYDGHMAQKPSLAMEHPMYTIFSGVIDRYIEYYGFDGIYWKGMLCLRLDDAKCGEGYGSDSQLLTKMLQSVVSEFSSVELWFGEDDDNVNYPVSNDVAIENIVHSHLQKGIDFTAKRDLRTERSIREIMLQKEIDVDAVHHYFSLMYNKSLADITTIESLESANSNRLFTLMNRLENDPHFAVKRVLLMNLMWLMTPGVVAFTQGSEFITDVPMQDKAGPLFIQENVGIVENGGLTSLGQHYGVFELIRKMVLFRRMYRFYDHQHCQLVYRSDRNRVLALSFNIEATPIVVVMNLSPVDYSEKPVTITIPAPFAWKTTWYSILTSDNSTVYDGARTVDGAFSVFGCEGTEPEPEKTEKPDWTEPPEPEPDPEKTEKPEENPDKKPEKSPEKDPEKDPEEMVGESEEGTKEPVKKRRLRGRWRTGEEEQFCANIAIGSYSFAVLSVNKFTVA